MRRGKGGRVDHLAERFEVRLRNGMLRGGKMLLSGSCLFSVVPSFVSRSLLSLCFT